MTSMIYTPHPLLVEKLPQIRRSRDAFKGTDAIKATNQTGSIRYDEDYLPRLGGQSLDEYANYKRRAVFYAAMNRTVVALVGALCRKPATVDNGDELEEFMKDVTGTGISFDEFLKRIESEILTSGRVIICVDRMSDENNNRPYLIWYKSEDCINWFTTKNTSFDQSLNKVVFKETYYDVDDTNPYLQVVRDQYREYVLGADKSVTVNIHRPLGDSKNSSYGDTVRMGQQYEITETRTMTNRGKALGFLPVTMVVSSGGDYEVPTPPLLDLVDVNIAHYRNSADFEHGLHWTALPTPYFTGLSDSTATISIGSGAAIILPEGGSAGFLEFNGAGLGKISEAMKHKEGLMSTLGARMLSSGMDQSTSAEVVRINVSGEISALINVAKSMSRCIARTLRMVSLWENNKNAISIDVHINEDYVDTKLGAGDIQALLKAFQGGALSLDTLLWNLEQGERLPVGRSIEDEIALIELGAEKEAETAMSMEGEGSGFAGNFFSSAEGSNETDEDLSDEDVSDEDAESEEPSGEDS